MVDLSRGLRHLAWADDKLFAALAGLPLDALSVSYAPHAWTVGRLATHIVGGAEWYRYCLLGIPWTDLHQPEEAADLEVFRQHLAQINAVLLSQADLPDDEVTFRDDDGSTTVWRSTLLTQAILHSIEHRAQIACALELAGYDAVRLDDYDLWQFEAYERGRAQG